MRARLRPAPGPAAAVAALAFLAAVGCADTSGPRWVEDLVPIPDSAHLEPGESAEFRVRVIDQRGEDMPAEWIPRVHWTLLGSSVAEIDTLEAGVRVTALQPGETAVRAELGRGQSNATIYVRPPGLDHVEIDPPLVRINSGGNRIVVARLFDASGAELDRTGFRISWEVLDSALAWVPFSYNPWYATRVGGLGVQGQTVLKLNVSGLHAFADVVLTPEPTTPETPVVTPLSSASLEVIWNRVFSARDGYRVYRAASEQGAYALVGSPGKGAGLFASVDSTYVDTGLAPSTTYFYAVEACNADGCSERSPPGSGTTGGGE